MSEPRVWLEDLPDTPREWSSDGVYVTAAEVRDVLTSSHLHCCWQVTRDGRADVCGKPAVAIRYDESNGGVGEVCKHHAKRMLVPLSFIATVADSRPVGGS